MTTGNLNGLRKCTSCPHAKNAHVKQCRKCECEQYTEAPRINGKVS